MRVDASAGSAGVRPAGRHRGGTPSRRGGGRAAVAAAPAADPPRATSRPPATYAASSGVGSSSTSTCPGHGAAAIAAAAAPPSDSGWKGHSDTGHSGRRPPAEGAPRIAAQPSGTSAPCTSRDAPARTTTARRQAARRDSVPAVRATARDGRRKLYGASTLPLAGCGGDEERDHAERRVVVGKTRQAVTAATPAHKALPSPGTRPASPPTQRATVSPRARPLPLRRAK
jgi:hypothetical protein